MIPLVQVGLQTSQLLSQLTDEALENMSFPTSKQHRLIINGQGSGPVVAL